ncbi:MAG TPA: TolC family protein [Terriglobales bacterium]|nr:TolC family protein [Terriglobales bacterium]
MKRMAATLTILLVAGALAPAQNPAPLRLTLEEAIARALKWNLSVRLASAEVEDAAGTRERQLSALLPHVTADNATSLHNTNLVAFGLSAPGLPIPRVVGPLSNYDYRAAGSQAIVDRQAYHALKSAERQQDATKLSYQDTRDLVVRETAGLYLQSQTAQAQVEADESRVATSQALLKLAQDQHNHGLATGVDVVRAQVQLQRDEQTLLVARDDYDTSILNLERFIGMTPGEPIVLAQRLEFYSLQPPDISAAVETALEARADYRSLFAQRQALVEQQKAARARYLPKFTVDGNYGPLGRTYGFMPGIGLIEGVVSVTVFDRDREGQQAQITSQLHKIDAQIADLRRGIEQDLRKAVLDLQSAEQQVKVTQAGLDLAERELTLAQDRFKNGLGDNVEVITAQSSLQSAEDDHIAALARHADAAVALGRALGANERNYQKYLGGQ